MTYLALDTSDVTACLRHHAQLIADGTRKRPVKVFLVEQYADGTEAESVFGDKDTSWPT